MKNISIIALMLIFIQLSFAQNTYFVSKDGTGNFSTIGQVNSAGLNSGDIVSFKSGDQFADAVLNCKAGVTYTSYGSGKAIIGNGLSIISSDATIKVDFENVKISNLKIFGYAYAYQVIAYSKGNLTIEDCEIIGGQYAHTEGTRGISQMVTDGAGSNLSFQRNIIHNMTAGIYLGRPYNVDIGYNEIYNLWLEGAIQDNGGCAISYRTTWNANGTDTYDAGYTFIIHHNNIHHFEYVAFTAGVSRTIYEYNEIHDNLDERIYRGGVKHGSIGKIFDAGPIGSEGCVGLIFRYNYVHDLIRRGQANFTYGVPNQANRDSGVPVTVSTNNGYGTAVYLYAGRRDINYGDHFGDGLDNNGNPQGEGPDQVLSGMSYGNYWVHNNIFYNCSNSLIASGGGISNLVFRPDLGNYFINNTVIKCGWLEYVTESYGLIWTRIDAVKPTTIVNNIFDYALPNARMTGRYWEGNLYLGHNIYLNQSGVSTSLVSIGAQKATVLQYSAVSNNKIQNEQYLVNQSNVWNDTASTIFVANIGVGGAYIPDVRITNDGVAHDEGMAYNLIGDDFIVKGQTHVVGKDPTGRSFAYDILGNLRTTKDIGAVGTVTSTPTPQSGLRVNLEGSYVQGKLRTDLNSSKFFPYYQPYNVSPWNITDLDSVSPMLPIYVDWILVEFRDDPAITKYWKVAILTEDGRVLNPDGSPFWMYMPSGEYYIVIKHRNHLAIMSAQKIYVEKWKDIDYDFTDSQSKAYGENAMVKLDNGKYGMIAGDADANGLVNVLDYSTVANSILLKGYAQGDTDMNGIINVLDYSFIGKNMLRKTNVP